jgi:TP901 family phage tail tape measure protein
MAGKQLSIGMLLSLTDRISAPLKKVVDSVGGIGKAAETAAGKFTRLHNQIDRVAKQAQKLDAIGKPLAAVGVAGAAGIAATVTQFANLEEAQIRLKTNLMDAAGKVGPEYEKLNRLAEKLGTDLPGSTKDMLELFTALREQGVQTNVILGGMGEAAAKFAVLMKVPFAEAATHVAKFSEAMGIADKDAVSFMDVLQRLKSAGGVEVNDLAESFKYMGSSLKALKIQGMDASKEVSAAIGLMATSSIEGSQAGTNFAQALSRMAEMSHKLDSKRIKDLVGPILDAKGIKLNMFDEAGNFVGIRGMVAELEKLRAINPQEQLVVLSKLFGQEASRPLSVFINQGVAGFDEMTRRMQQQADTQTKINEIMGSTKMRWESLTRTVGNRVSNMGGIFSKVMNLPGLFEKLNALVGRMNEWVLANPKIAAVLGTVVVSLTGLALAAGGVLMAVSAIGAAVGPFLAGMASMLRLSGLLATGIKGVLLALRAVSAFMLTNPIGLTITAIATAAFLIYRYWGPIKGFFTGIWQAVVSVAGKMRQAGANIITSLVDGIKRMASKPVEAMKAIVQKVRNFLPFSPAKEGPLRDIHRVKIMETIAGAMTPGPMVKAMRTATAATMIAAAPMAAGAAGPGGGGGAKINFAPTINLSAGTPGEVRQQIDQALSTSQAELERMIDRIMAQKQRRAF